MLTRWQPDTSRLFESSRSMTARKTSVTWWLSTLPNKRSYLQFQRTVAFHCYCSFSIAELAHLTYLSNSILSIYHRSIFVTLFDYVFSICFIFFFVYQYWFDQRLEIDVFILFWLIDNLFIFYFFLHLNRRRGNDNNSRRTRNRLKSTRNSNFKIIVDHPFDPLSYCNTRC